MHISDLKEIYFEKAVCKAKHTYIHTSTLIFNFFMLKNYEIVCVCVCM